MESGQGEEEVEATTMRKITGAESHPKRVEPVIGVGEDRRAQLDSSPKVEKMGKVDREEWPKQMMHLGVV